MSRGAAGNQTIGGWSKDDSSVTDSFASLHWQKALALVAEAFDEKVFKDLGNKVLDGPFKNMLIPSETIWQDGNNASKLFGTYEHELHYAIEKAISRKPRYVINHGCAEGYYAIGLAKRLPDAYVIAIDCRKECIDTCIEYVKLNGISDQRMAYAVGSESFSPVSLHRFPESDHYLYVVDVEGDELEVLDLERVPELADSDIIVECHDFENIPHTSKTLIERFKDTHDIEVVYPQMPSIPAFLDSLPVIIRFLLATDKRPLGSFWLVCFAKSFETNILWNGLKNIGFESIE